MSKDLRKVSRESWNQDENRPTHQDLHTGCMLRIADATEAMAKNHTDLLYQKMCLQKRNERLKEQLEDALSSNGSLKGHITRLKKKLKEYENTK